MILENSTAIVETRVQIVGLERTNWHVKNRKAIIGGVAGAKAPAFVERRLEPGGAAVVVQTRVAGAKGPAFVLLIRA